MEVMFTYAPTLWVAIGIGGLLLLQIVIADLLSIRAQHKPGFPIEADQHSLLFRSARVYANTNETIAAFGLFALVGILAAASPAWLNGFALFYFVGRVGHMLFYYWGLSVLRSLAFGVSLLALFGMLATAAVAMIGT